MHKHLTSKKVEEKVATEVVLHYFEAVEHPTRLLVVIRRVEAHCDMQNSLPYACERRRAKWRREVILDVEYIVYTR